MTKVTRRKLERVFDARGREIVVGAKVAFNLSGDLALGVIEKVEGFIETREGWWHPYYRYNVHVKLVERHGNHNAGHVSKVKNNSGIIVLDQFPGTVN